MGLLDFEVVSIVPVGNLSVPFPLGRVAVPPAVNTPVAITLNLSPLVAVVMNIRCSVPEAPDPNAAPVSASPAVPVAIAPAIQCLRIAELASVVCVRGFGGGGTLLSGSRRVVVPGSEPLWTTWRLDSDVGLSLARPGHLSG